MNKVSKNSVSEGAAVKLLNRLFAAHKDSNELTLEEIYSAAGRTDMDAETNRNWFNGVLAKLKRYNFVDTVTTYENSRHKVVGMKLTIAGQYILGRKVEGNMPPGTPDEQPSRTSGLTLDEMLAAIEELREKYTGFDIELVIKPKGTPMGR
jgi:hypothetical protein